MKNIKSIWGSILGILIILGLFIESEAIDKTLIVGILFIFFKMYASLKNKEKKVIVNNKVESKSKDIFIKSNVINENYKNKESSCFNTKIVGVTFDSRQKVVKKLMPGDKVFIIREYNNKFDSNAIAVLNNNQESLGYLPKEISKDLASKIDNKAMKCYGNIISVGNKENNYGATIKIRKTYYVSELDSITWQNELTNSIKDIYDLGLGNTNIRERFDDYLPNTNYYRSTYMCPCCSRNLLYKVKAREVLSYKINGDKIRLYNIFTCTKCRVFFASIYVGKYNNFMKLSDYALQSTTLSQYVYKLLLNETSKLYSINEDEYKNFSWITVKGRVITPNRE